MDGKCLNEIWKSNLFPQELNNKIKHHKQILLRCNNSSTSERNRVVKRFEGGLNEWHAM